VRLTILADSARECYLADAGAPGDFGSVPRAVASVALPGEPPSQPRSLPLAVLIRPHRSKIFLEEQTG